MFYNESEPFPEVHDSVLALNCVHLVKSLTDIAAKLIDDVDVADSVVRRILQHSGR